MARGDQLVRQWTILNRLREGRISRRELSVELDVSLKTVSRDIDALSLFPITELREGIDVFYEMLPESRLPGISFEPPEVVALLFAKDMILRSLEDTPFEEAFLSALQKVEKNQRSRTLRNLERLPDVYQVYSTSQRTVRRFDESLLQTLIDAALDTKQLRMKYFSAHRQALSERTVNPLVIYQSPHGFRLIAYCHLREEVRIFSLNQIRSLVVLERTFDLKAHRFNLEAFLSTAFADMRSEPIIDVRLRIAHPTAHWAKDRNYHPSQEIIEIEGGIEITFRSGGLPAIAAQVLGLGPDCTVLEPTILREFVYKRALQIAELHRSK